MFSPKVVVSKILIVVRFWLRHELRKCFSSSISLGSISALSALYLSSPNYLIALSVFCQLHLSSVSQNFEHSSKDSRSI